MGTLVLCLAALCHGGEAAHAGGGVHSVCRLELVRAARQNSAPRLGLSAAVPPGPRLGCTTQQTWNKNFRNSDAAYWGEGSRAGAGKVFIVYWVCLHTSDTYLSINKSGGSNKSGSTSFVLYISTYLIFYRPNTQLSFLSLFWDMDSLVFCDFKPVK